MRGKAQSGQAILVVLLALSLVMVGAMGLAVDGAQLFAHQQMAQAAADAAAQAGVMSLFDNTSGWGGHAAPTVGATFTCTTGSDAAAPCVYARSNGFSNSAADSVVVSFPDPASGYGATVTSGVSLSSDPVKLIKVQVQRTVQNGLLRFLGPATQIVQATAVAAIVSVLQPTPILVSHPNLSGALSVGGSASITICGGPSRSIQVNSSSPTAVSVGTVDLSKAGPLDSGTCTTGTGADFAVHGGPTAKPGGINLGTAGNYVQPSSIMQDPLASVPEPANPITPGTQTVVHNPTNGCPVANCTLYSPGLYTSYLQIKNDTALFEPGLYYMQGGFGNAANGNIQMATGVANNAVTGAGMVMYITGNGTIDLTANASAVMRGSDTTSIYKGILFFVDRRPATQNAQTHTLGHGNSQITIVGTVYANDSNANALAGNYQTIALGGTGGSGTTITGMIITNVLTMIGTPAVTMNLSSTNLTIRSIALIH